LRDLGDIRFHDRIDVLIFRDELRSLLPLLRGKLEAILAARRS